MAQIDDILGKLGYGSTTVAEKTPPAVSEPASQPYATWDSFKRSYYSAGVGPQQPQAEPPQAASNPAATVPQQPAPDIESVFAKLGYGSHGTPVVPAVEDQKAQSIQDKSIGFTKALPKPPSDFDIDSAIKAAYKETGIYPTMIKAIAAHESHFVLDATPPQGKLPPSDPDYSSAYGLMQLTDTAIGDMKAQGFVINKYDPAQNLLGGAIYYKMKMQEFNGDGDLAMAAYFKGGGKVRSWMRRAERLGIDPKEYVLSQMDEKGGATVGDYLKDVIEKKTQYDYLDAQQGANYAVVTPSEEQKARQEKDAIEQQHQARGQMQTPDRNWLSNVATGFAGSANAMVGGMNELISKAAEKVPTAVTTALTMAPLPVAQGVGHLINLAKGEDVKKSAEQMQEVGRYYKNNPEFQNKYLYDTPMDAIADIPNNGMTAVGELGKMTAEGILKSVPYIMPALTGTPGMYAAGVAAGAEKYTDLEERTDMSAIEKMLNVGGTTLVQTYLGKVFGEVAGGVKMAAPAILKEHGRVGLVSAATAATENFFKRAGLGVLLKGVKNTAPQILKEQGPDALVKAGTKGIGDWALRTGINTAEGEFGVVASTVVQGLVDVATGADTTMTPDKLVKDAVGAAITFLPMSLGFGALGAAGERGDIRREAGKIVQQRNAEKVKGSIQAKNADEAEQAYINEATARRKEELGKQPLMLEDKFLHGNVPGYGVAIAAKSGEVGVPQQMASDALSKAAGDFQTPRPQQEALSFDGDGSVAEYVKNNPRPSKTDRNLSPRELELVNAARGISKPSGGEVRNTTPEEIADIVESAPPTLKEIMDGMSPEAQELVVLRAKRLLDANTWDSRKVPDEQAATILQTARKKPDAGAKVRLPAEAVPADVQGQALEHARWLLDRLAQKDAEARAAEETTTTEQQPPARQATQEPATTTADDIAALLRQQEEAKSAISARNAIKNGTPEPQNRGSDEGGTTTTPESPEGFKALKLEEGVTPDAEGTGAKVVEGGGKEGVEGEAQGGLPVRYDAEAGVEAQPGKEVAVAEKVQPTKSDEKTFSKILHGYRTAIKKGTISMDLVEDYGEPSVRVSSEKFGITRMVPLSQAKSGAIESAFQDAVNSMTGESVAKANEESAAETERSVELARSNKREKPKTDMRVLTARQKNILAFYDGILGRTVEFDPNNARHKRAISKHEDGGGIATLKRVTRKDANGKMISKEFLVPTDKLSDMRERLLSGTTPTLVEATSTRDVAAPGQMRGVYEGNAIDTRGKNIKTGGERMDANTLREQVGKPFDAESPVQRALIDNGYARNSIELPSPAEAGKPTAEGSTARAGGTLRLTPKGEEFLQGAADDLFADMMPRKGTEVESATPATPEQMQRATEFARSFLPDDVQQKMRFHTSRPGEKVTTDRGELEPAQRGEAHIVADKTNGVFDVVIDENVDNPTKAATHEVFHPGFKLLKAADPAFEGRVDALMSRDKAAVADLRKTYEGVYGEQIRKVAADDADFNRRMDHNLRQEYFAKQMERLAPLQEEARTSGKTAEELINTKYKGNILSDVWHWVKDSFGKLLGRAPTEDELFRFAIKSARATRKSNVDLRVGGERQQQASPDIMYSKPSVKTLTEEAAPPENPAKPVAEEPVFNTTADINRYKVAHVTDVAAKREISRLLGESEKPGDAAWKQAIEVIRKNVPEFAEAGAKKETAAKAPRKEKPYEELTQKQKINYDVHSAAKKAIKSIEDHFKLVKGRKRFDKVNASIGSGEGSYGERMSRVSVAAVDNAVTTIQQLAREVDGSFHHEGEVYKSIVNPLKDGEINHDRSYYDRRDYLREGTKGLKVHSMTRTSLGRALRIANRITKHESVELIDATSAKGEKFTMTPAERIAVALTARQEKGMKALTEDGFVFREGHNARTLTPAEVKRLVDGVNASSRDRKVMEVIDGYFKNIASKEIQRIGMELFGKDILVKGEEYYPLLRNGADLKKTFDFLMKTENDVDFKAAMKGDYVPEGAIVENPSITKERSKSANTPIVIMDAFEMVARYGAQLDRLNYATPLRNARAFFHQINPTLEKYFPRHAESFKKAFDDIESRPMPDATEKFFNEFAYKPYAIGVLSYNPVSILSQFLSIPQISYELGLKNFTYGMMKAASFKNSKLFHEQIKKYAPSLRKRYEGTVNTETGMLNRQAEGRALYKQTTTYSDIAMKAISVADRIVIQPAWFGSQKEAISKGFKENTPEFWNYVNKRTMEIISETQQTYSPTDLTEFQRRGGVFVKMLAPFQSQMYKQWSLLKRQAHEFRRGDIEQKKHAAAGMVTSTLIPLLGMSSLQYARLALTGNEEEREKYGGWLGALDNVRKNTLSYMPGVGNILNTVIDAAEVWADGKPLSALDRALEIPGMNTVKDATVVAKQLTDAITGRDGEGYMNYQERMENLDKLHRSAARLLKDVGVMGIPPLEWMYKSIKRFNED